MPSNAAPTFTTNAAALTAKLNSASGKIEDPRALLEQCRRILSEQETEVWATEGAALEAAWKQAVQPDRKVNSELLVASGALKSSMSDADAGRIRGATLRIKVKPYYGFFHQFGTTKMDARPFSGISDNSMRLIMQRFQEATDQDLGV